MVHLVSVHLPSLAIRLFSGSVLGKGYIFLVLYLFGVHLGVGLGVRYRLIVAAVPVLD